MTKRWLKGNTILIKDNKAEILIESKVYGQLAAYVDIDDIPKISKFTWYANYDKKKNNFYIKTSCIEQGKQKILRLANVIANNTNKFIDHNSLVVDHINGNTLDNRKSNLRLCSQIENSYNNKNNTSGMRGVTWHKIAKKWQVRITKNKKCVFSELFSSFEDAKNARIKAEKKLQEVDK